MLQYWIMDRQELEKPTPWKVSSTTWAIHREVSFQEAWRKYLSSFRLNRARIQHLWSELVTYRYTMKSFQIF